MFKCTFLPKQKILKCKKMYKKYLDDCWKTKKYCPFIKRLKKAKSNSQPIQELIKTLIKATKLMFLSNQSIIL